MRRTHPDQPALITTAHESPDDEYDRRRKKYAVMMALRALCVLAAALTYRASIWLALGLVVGGAVLPWCAVLIANDGPAKKRAPHLAHVVANTERGLPSGHDDRTLDG
jgi:Flp pilus assembly protein TadB